MNIKKINAPKDEVKGNVLFLILIAVALFAALSYAITQSGRGGGSGISKENTQIRAAQAVQALAAIKAAAMRMVLSGVSVDDIKVHTPGSVAEPCTDTDGTCLFTPDGGGATWPVFPDDTYNQELIAAINLPAINLGKAKATSAGDACGSSDCPGSVAGIGTALPEVGIGLAAITESVCAAINKGLGRSSIPVQDPTDFAANFGSGYVTFTATPGEEALCVDISEAAFGNPAAGFYIYYQVLIAR